MRRRVLEQVEGRYADEMKAASFWRRVWIKLKIRRQVVIELKKEFHPANLHGRDGAK